jgi:hypothetical protein
MGVIKTFLLELSSGRAQFCQALWVFNPLGAQMMMAEGQGILTGCTVQENSH